MNWFKRLFNFKRVPVNIFIGELGSGKTTIIKNILTQLPYPDRIVWLKNEYGNQNVDAQMLKETNVKVSEVLNGCLCCVLVGRLDNALQDIMRKYSPERIIIESSGSAYPAPIVLQVQKNKGLFVDGVVNVVDALNFGGYDDKSYNAKLQSNYVDLIAINKYPNQPTETEQSDLDQRLDDVYNLFPSVNKVKTTDGKLPVSAVIGIATNNSYTVGNTAEDNHDAHVDVLDLVSAGSFSRDQIESWSKTWISKGVYRAKGVLWIGQSPILINWVAGRSDWQEIRDYKGQSCLSFFSKNVKLSPELSQEFQNLEL